MPWCPDCRYEYLEGVETCPDCGTRLVVGLTPEPSPTEGPNHELVSVFHTYDPNEARLIQTHLTGAGFTCFLKGEILARLYVPLLSPIDVQVPDVEAEAARALLAEMEASRRRTTGRELSEVPPAHVSRRFCPECDGEYWEPIAVCPECGVELVDERPSERALALAEDRPPAELTGRELEEWGK